jgi:hypothetical protein
MATMPASGTIGSATLASVFGGTAPRLSSQFYRGGARVPATRTTTTTTTTFGTWSAYRFNAFTLGGGPDPGNVNDGWILLEQKSTGFIVSGEIWSGGVFIGNSTGTLFNFGSGSGFQFERGALVGSNEDSTYTYYFYQIRSRSFSTTTTTSTVDVNTGVPTSGQISSNQWYGAVSS